MTMPSSFSEDELRTLDRAAAHEGVPPALLRALVHEQVRSRADGRAGLRAALDALLDAAAAETIGPQEPVDAD